MPRALRDLTPEERVGLIAAIQTEAEAAGWHSLNNAQKRVLYDRWAQGFDLARPAIKDGIMKGFDVAQGVPATGEAALHQEVVALLSRSPVPHWGSKVPLWGGRAQADFVIGYSRALLTHTIELEPAPTWRNGLMQALWYKSAYYQESGVQAIPTIILFGKVSRKRWEEIRTTCLDQRAQVLGHRLSVEGNEPEHSLSQLLLGRSAE
jgi:hypothetical protein